MVAVMAFVGGRPRTALAFGTGVRWGVGHAVALMAAGGLLAWTGLTLPEAAGLWMEMGVGVLLISVGIWVVRTASRLHVHGPPKHDGHAHLHAHEGSDHSHSHVHSSNSHFRHRHLTTLVGAFHGLAGTAPLVALLPVTMISDIWAAFGYPRRLVSAPRCPWAFTERSPPPRPNGRPYPLPLHTDWLWQRPSPV